MTRPQPNEYAPYYETYVSLVKETDIVTALRQQNQDFLQLLEGISEATSLIRHPPFTWSVKQVIGHMTDAERVFSYRALRFARNDPTPLPGFDENPYVAHADFDRWPVSDLVLGFSLLRESNVLLFAHLPEAAWERVGTASDHAITVKALAYILVGHARHHLNIVRKRLSPA